jgi:hypothetical protein
MGSHKSKSCSDVPVPPTPPPPPPVYIVSGDGNPSPNGVYNHVGFHDGFNCYKHELQDWWIFRNAEEELWIIGDGIPSPTHSWEREDLVEFGEYEAARMTEGFAYFEVS